MAKSISLSTDMTVLYFIDNSGFLQAFPLDGNGVFITSIAGEVQVVTATKQFQGGNDECEITSTAQWDVFFHEDTTQVMFIGDNEIDATATGQIKKYDVSGGSVINARLDSTLTKILIRT